MFRVTASLLPLLICISTMVAAPPAPTHADITFRTVDGVDLQLDLYLPAPEAQPAPCVIFVHGGGWKNGDKKSAARTAAWLTEHGFAIVSINYRLTNVAPWPAQIDDCYAAVRWVRENGSRYGIQSERIGVWGTSAGGHLAALMGTRADPEGGEVSRVQAVCDWFGPSELLSMPPNIVGNGRTEADVAGSNGAKLLGATVKDNPKLARDASALDQVDANDASFLIMHGDQDPGVPLEQSQQLHAKLVRNGVDSQLVVVRGAGHGGKQFQTLNHRTTMVDFFRRQLIGDWNQSVGPTGRFVSPHTAVTQWSVVRGENIAWRKQLPETGQSAVIGWRGRIYFSIMKPVMSDESLGSDIVAYCCDATTGETIWKREIPGQYPLRLSGCFSDSSAPSPVVQGQRVCFFNASGTVQCFDLDGRPIWQRHDMPVGRTQPFLIDGNVVFTKQSYMPDEHGHFTHEHKDAPVDRWTQLQALDMQSGAEVWATTCGVNMGCVPLPLVRPDGKRVIVVGRGGGHSPPEKPEGISMVDAESGETLWTLPLSKFMSTMAMHSYGDHVLVFDADQHLWVNSYSGKVERRVSILDTVSVRSWDMDQERYRDESRTVSLMKKTRAIIQQSNVLAGRYHYFRSYTQPWLGRVDVVSSKVEYLQLPVQLRRHSDSQEEDRLWGPDGMTSEQVERAMESLRKRPRDLPIQLWTFRPNEMKNSRGFRVVGDIRSCGNGWGHHASAVPTVIGEYLYLPTMAGTVYVIRWNCETLDETCVAGINDLGGVGQAWNRASITFSDGKLMAHTIGEVIAIGVSR